MSEEKTPKARGRPKEFEALVSVRLPGALHDDLSREAIRRHVDLADVMRERLAGNSVSQKSQR